MKIDVDKYKAGNVKMISEEEINETKMGLTKYINEWRKRKRGCMDIVEQISESMEMNPKAFMVNLNTFILDFIYFIYFIEKVGA
jgi:Leucine zipper with capping helix domain